MSEQAINSKPIDKWIPWFFVLFFLVIAILDGIFVTVAVKTHTGVVTEDAYEKGLAYNETISLAKEQQAMGWKADITLQGADKLTVTLTDNDGNKLDGAVLVAKVTRPVQDGHDFEIELSGSSNGVYSAPVNFPLQGKWNVRVFATWQDKHYQSSKTIIVR